MLQRYHGWVFFSGHIRLFWLGGGGKGVYAEQIFLGFGP